MRKHEKGFSFLELLMVMVIMGFVLAGGSEMFVSLLRGYKQQSKITETNIEGIIGLELLRRDIESAGYGLPWVIPAGTTYQEATNTTADDYNDSTTSAPRALLSGDNIGTGGAGNNIVNGSDYLVVKAINLGRNDACTKWTNLLTSGATTTWDPSTEDLFSTDRVIVISPGATATNSRSLAGPTGANLGSILQFSGVSALADPNETRIVYGVAPADGANLLGMPFNRADYYVSTSVTIPGRCAPGTGVLLKAIVSQSDGGFDGGNMLPLLDCVADMQVVTRLDMTIPPDGQWEATSDGFIAANAQAVRDQLNEVHVYLLVHEGQRDTSYTHGANTILVGEQVGATVFGRNFDLTTITNWQNYRWKVYTLVVRSNNLR